MASSRRSTAPAKSSPTTSPGRRATSTSSPTRSTSSTTRPVVIALGSNLGDRRLTLLRAIEELKRVVRVVRISAMIETEPVDAPPGSPKFMNIVVAGLTRLEPEPLLRELLAIEAHLGRVRRGRNAPRTIDLDLIFYSGRVQRTRDLTLPHPRYREREFVLRPMRELRIYPWRAGVPAVDDSKFRAARRRAAAAGTAAGRF